MAIQFHASLHKSDKDKFSMRSFSFTCYNLRKIIQLYISRRYIAVGNFTLVSWRNLSRGVIGMSFAFDRLCGYEPFYDDDERNMFKKILKVDYEFDPQWWSEVSENAKVRMA